MAKFSKQHYQEIARILRKHRECADPENAGEQATVYSITSDLAAIFALDNSCFNRDHFLAVVEGIRPVNSRPPR
jgi:hypothetical protein